jgi:hypothetical protein
VKSLRALLLLLPIAASPLAAQRSLHWREVRIDATLATGGALRVKETQTIAFTGDWNGGERRFDFVRVKVRVRACALDSTVTHACARDLSAVDG